MNVTTIVPSIRSRSELPDVIRRLNLRIGVEVGVFRGRFSAFLLQYSSLDVLYSVDVWLTETSPQPGPRRHRTVNHMRDACLKLSPFGSRSVIIRTNSTFAASMFESGSLDFVYIDADHTMRAVQRDLDCWWPKVKRGGVFAGHDYLNRRRCAVKDAVDQFCAVHALRPSVTVDDRWPTWLLIKE